MNILNLIKRLKENAVSVSADNGKLKLSGRTEGLPEGLIQEVLSNKEAIIELLRQSAPAMRYQSIPVAPRSDLYPLSNAQRRIWTISQFDGGLEAYTIVNPMYLSGKVDHARLEKAFQACVRRHDALRTVFVEVNSEIFQVVKEAIAISIEEQDISTECRQSGLLLEACREAGRMKFDLENGPLLRIKLYRIDRERSALIVCIHHIICDGWSMRVLMREMLENYRLLGQGAFAEPGPLRIQYKDYAAWAAGRLSEAGIAEGEQFWRDSRLSEAAPLELPIDRPRGAARNFDGAIIRRWFDADLFEKVQDHARAHQSTLFNFLLACLNVLLYKLSGQREIVVGTPVAGRNHSDLEDQIGLFVNTLALKSGIDPEQSFRDYLAATTAQTFRAFEFQEYPFESVVDAAGSGSQDAARNPLFDVMIILQNTSAEFSAAEMTDRYGFCFDLLDKFLEDPATLARDNGTAKFDLSFNFTNELSDKFCLELEYNTALFHSERITMVLNSYFNVLEQLLAGMDLRIKEIELADPLERERILRELNHPPSFIPEKSIQGLLDTAKWEGCEDIAVEGDDLSFTYAQLELYSNHLAGYLAEALGGQRDAFVAVLIDRSPLLAVAFLSILKAGAGYVPIDILYPASRIGFILEDARPALLIVDDKSSLLPLDDSIPRLNISSYAFNGGAGSFDHDEDLRQRVAYMMYTSGSTGKPKGVRIQHRNTIAFLKWAMWEFRDTPFDRLLSATSVCFDLSIFELFLPLCLGKKMRILTSALDIQGHLNGAERIMLNTVPSVVRSLIENKADLSKVTALNMAGEEVPKIFRDLLPLGQMEVRNLYGPTETTTYSTCHRFGKNDTGNVPIGSPIRDVQIYILDADGRLLPEGIRGEICIGGETVASGYHGQDELTDAKFVSNPFLPGKKMYMTGDMGKWLPDGQIAFLGRKDQQVKIRGMRIETGEIQYLIDKIPGVEQSFVIAADIDGEKSLVVYWTGEQLLTEKDVRNNLSQSLPANMMPTHWVKMDAFPLTASGKVDRRKLPDPARQSVKTGADSLPETLLHQRLLEFWRLTLQMEVPGIDKNFFELGGHSLKAYRLRSLIARHLGKDISINKLFAYPTIREQARLVEQMSHADHPRIPAVAPAEFYPLSYSQERLWMLSSFTDASRAYHMNAAFAVNGGIDIAILETVFLTLCRRHEILRTVFVERQGQPWQAVRDADTFSFGVKRVNVNEPYREAILENILDTEWYAPFDLSAGPLLRIMVISFGDGVRFLTFSMHHIIGDGWSLNILVEELMRLYDVTVSGKELSLAPLPLHFKDFAAWEKENHLSRESNGSRNFWRKEFEKELSPLLLPADHYRPEVKTYGGNVFRTAFSPALSTAIGSLSLQEGASLFMTLVAGVAVLLKKCSNQDDLVIGTPIAGRPHPQLEEQIGFFVNMLPVRFSVNGGRSFKDLLADEKAHLLDILHNQEFPFELLLNEIGGRRDLSRSPLFDVAVTLQDMEGAGKREIRSALGLLQLTRVDTPVRFTKYDLTFAFSNDKGGINLELEYNTDLFAGETVSRMAGQLSFVFEQATSRPSGLIRDIEILDEETKRAVVDKLNNSAVPFDRTDTISGHFRHTARQFPEKTALVVDDRSMTYGELGERSRRLAHLLRSRYGVGKGDMVLLHCERSEWMIVAILGTLMAGAAYVPVDPAYPVARKQYIARDSNCKLLLYDVAPPEALVAQMASLTDPMLSAMETGDIDFAEPGLPAYVIYTSGTTGDPKGVIIGHSNVIRLLFTERPVFLFGPSDVWTLFHSYCFDFSVWEMYGALLNGATLVIVPRLIAANSIEFYTLLNHRGVTVLNQTPTAFRSLVQLNKHRFRSEPLCIRYLIFGGEALMPAILREWAEAFPFCRNINMYGITETTVHVTYKEIGAREIAQNKSNIGAPIPTLSCYVLDEDLRPVPPMVIGELCVGGEGLAQGYLNKPELTALSFVPNPFKAGEWVYRSGDYARILPDGEMEYIGRRDHQVKIRGHRIEIREIENAFLSHPEVKGVVIVANKNADLESELIAYFLAGRKLDMAELRRFLDAALPGYMIPSRSIQLDAFPMTENGKLDRTALLQDLEPLTREFTHLPARNDTDEKLVRIWQEVLGRGGIGIKDNFFDLGGHSLRATRIIARISEEFGVKIDLKQLFFEPTIEQLSDYIDAIGWIQEGAEAIPEGRSEIIL